MKKCSKCSKCKGRTEKTIKGKCSECYYQKVERVTEPPQSWRRFVIFQGLKHAAVEIDDGHARMLCGAIGKFEVQVDEKAHGMICRRCEIELNGIASWSSGDHAFEVRSGVSARDERRMPKGARWEGNKLYPGLCMCGRRDAEEGRIRCLVCLELERVKAKERRNHV